MLSLQAAAASRKKPKHRVTSCVGPWLQPKRQACKVCRTYAAKEIGISSVLHAPNESAAPAAIMSSQALPYSSPPPEVQCHHSLEALAAGKQAREQASAAACINQHATLCRCQVAHSLLKLLIWPWEPCACKVLPPAPLVDEADQGLPEQLSALPLLLLVDLLGYARGDCEVQILAGRVKGAGTAAAGAGLVPAGGSNRREAKEGTCRCLKEGYTGCCGLQTCGHQSGPGEVSRTLTQACPE